MDNKEITISDHRFLRQLDIITPEELQTAITMIGCGGIGSPVVSMLAKEGCSNITVYDDDTVDEHNLPNQHFRPKDIGRPKVEAIKEIVKEFTDIEIVAKNERFTNQEVRGILISGVDRMSTRKEIWKHIRMNPKVKYYIDARMGGELATAFVVNPMDPDDCDEYDESLHSDEESDKMPCTARSIIYTVYGLASLIGVIIKMKAKGEQLPKSPIFFDFSKPMIFTS